MDWVRIAAVWYCTLAVLLLLAYGSTTVSAANQKASLRATAETILEQRIVVERQFRRIYDELRQRQREERPYLDGPDAINLSIAVQDAREVYLTAQRQRQDAEEQLNRLAAEQRARSLTLVPILAGLLFHIVALIALIPSRRSTRKARR
jgi:hypothetical protein